MNASFRAPIAMRLAATLSTALAAVVFATAAPLVHADETTEPTPVAPSATAEPTPAESPTPEPTPTPAPEPEPEPSPTVTPSPTEDTSQQDTVEAAQPQLALVSATPLRVGQTVQVRATFSGLKSANSWGEVWLSAENRWSRTITYATNGAGVVEIPLSWSSGSVGAQRWRAAAQNSDGSIVYTNELTIDRRPMPKATAPSLVLQYKAATLTGSFETAGAVQAWGEVWTGRHWSKTATFTTNATGGFSYSASWGSEHRGTQRWRFGMTLSDGSAQYTGEVSLTRRHPATVSRPGILEAGQSLTTWGSFDAQGTPATVWGEIWVGTHWSRTASVRTSGVGDYSITLSYNSWQIGTQRWRIAGQFADGTIQYTSEFNLTRHGVATVSEPMVLPANYPMSTFGMFPVSQSIRYWGEVWTGSYWSRTPVRWTDGQGNYTLDLSYGGDVGGTRTWRVGGLMPDGSTLYTRQFQTVRTAPLDPRCQTGRVLCATKKGLRLWWIVDGTILNSFDARFGKPGLDTREGVHRVLWKSRNHWSTIYDVAMPFAMFFNGGQAVHYSEGFASQGHIGAGSGGCINVRDYAGIARVFDQVRVGDRVVVYR